MTRSPACGPGAARSYGASGPPPTTTQREGYVAPPADLVPTDPADQLLPSSSVLSPAPASLETEHWQQGPAAAPERELSSPPLPSLVF